MSKNPERDIEIVEDVLNGKTHQEIAVKNKLTNARIGQIFWKFIRLLRSYDQRVRKERLQKIFTQDKYPHVWSVSGTEVKFSSHNIRLEDWRAEQQKMLDLIDEINNE